MLGKSVRGRPITAWHLDNRPIGNRRGPTVVLIATMHGNERAPRQILRALRGARVIHGVDLWLVPVYNPDGFGANSRRNAHGVDLNRNYPYHWADLDGNYESGAAPGVRAGDEGDDAVPPRRPPGLRARASTSRCTAWTPTTSGPASHDTWRARSACPPPPWTAAGSATGP